jgi:hypothetical protein
MLEEAMAFLVFGKTDPLAVRRVWHPSGLQRRGTSEALRAEARGKEQNGNRWKSLDAAHGNLGGIARMDGEIAPGAEVKA